MADETSDTGTAPWSATDSNPPDHRCGFELLPGDIEGGVFQPDRTIEEIGHRMWRENYKSASCCRTVWKNGRCRWHAEVESSVLQEAIVDRDERAQNLDGVVLRDLRTDHDISLVGCRLRGAIFEEVIVSNADFTDATLDRSEFVESYFLRSDFSGAGLRNTVLSGAMLSDSEFTEATFQEADLQGSELERAELQSTYFGSADLYGCDLGYSDCRGADFGSAEIRNTTMRGATMIDADLSDADISTHSLRDTDLTGADLRGATFDDVRVGGVTISDVGFDRSTSFDITGPEPPSVGEAVVAAAPVLGETGVPRGLITDEGARSWDLFARAYHQLKVEFDDNGFVGRARRFHRLERRARRYETAEAEGWFTRSHLTAFVSGLFTGYGVGVRRLLVTMAVLFVVGTAGYVAAGASDPLVRSVVAFTTSASPERVSGFPWWAKVAVAAETFLGTLLIVSLGFVLGNREQF